MGGVLSQVETDANGLEHVIATLENGERVPVCPSGITDSRGNCVDEGCASSRHDGRGPGLRPGGNGRERLDAAATPR